MTARVRVEGEVPSFQMFFNSGQLEVSQWPVWMVEDGGYWWKKYLIAAHPQFDHPEYIDPDQWVPRLGNLGAYGFRGMAAFELSRVRRTLELAKQYDLKWNATVASLKTSKQDLLSRLEMIRQNPEVFISIEGINEPDRDGLSDAEIAKTVEFQRLIRGFVDSHQELQHVTVLSPALRKPAGPELYERFANGGMKPDLYDAIAFHYYLTGPPDVKAIGEHMEMITEFWKRNRFWLTETGGTTATASSDPRRASERDLAAWAVQTIFEYGSDPRIEKMIRYELNDGKGGITDNEACFGMFRFDGSPKPEVGEIDNWIITTRNSGDPIGQVGVDLEVLSAPEDRVKAKIVGTPDSITLWLWRPGTDSRTEPVQVQVNTPILSKTVQLDGYPEGILL